MANAFADWLRTRPRGTAAKVARKTGLSLVTIYRARDDFPVHDETAKLISRATGGEVAKSSFRIVKFGAARDAQTARAKPRTAA